MPYKAPPVPPPVSLQCLHNVPTICFLCNFHVFEFWQSLRLRRFAIMKECSPKQSPPCSFWTSKDSVCSLLSVNFRSQGTLWLQLSGIVWSLCLTISGIRGTLWLQQSGIVWSFCLSISGLAPAVGHSLVFLSVNLGPHGSLWLQGIVCFFVWQFGLRGHSSLQVLGIV